MKKINIFLVIFILFLFILSAGCKKEEVLSYEKDIYFFNEMPDTIMIRCCGSGWIMYPGDTMTHDNSGINQNYWGKEYRVYLIKNKEICDYFLDNPPCFYKMGVVIGNNYIE